MHTSKYMSELYLLGGKLPQKAHLPPPPPPQVIIVLLTNTVYSAEQVERWCLSRGGACLNTTMNRHVCDIHVHVQSFPSGSTRD